MIEAIKKALENVHSWADLYDGPWWLALLAIGGVCFLLANFIAIYAGVNTLLERKIAGHMQSRVGPYQVGPHGSLQWVADALKLLFKEDVIPKDTDKLLFRLAPYVVFAGSLAAWCALPLTVGWSPASMNIGILYILAVSSAVVLGILMAGWSSGSKWSLFGAMRGAAQIVSYEVPVGIIIVAMLLIYGTLDMTKITQLQERGAPFGMSDSWYGGVLSWGVFRHAPFTIIAFLVYYTGALAETNRTPFDIPEAESELVAGYHTEYSGMRFSFFFLAEYANMFVVSAIATTFFLGGCLPPFMNHYHSATTVIGGIVIAGLVWGATRRAEYAGGALVAWAGALLVAGPFLWPSQQIFWFGGADAPAAKAQGVLWFFIKSFSLVLLMMWLRWTLPRYRVDQLMDLCWKKLTPLAFLCMFAIGVGEVSKLASIVLCVTAAVLIVAILVKEVLAPEKAPPPLPRVNP
jgi:NADH-quinone oxidoreductase subunit H